MAIPALFAGGAAMALDADLAITQYGHRVWRTDEGLPQNSVFSIAQSRAGYLWLATQEGLARFDGVRFKVFDKRNTPQIKHNDVWILFEDRAGNLWIGTRGGGLSKYADGAFTNYSKQDGLSNDSVQSITEDRSGDGVLAYSRVTFDNTAVASADVNLLLQNALGNLQGAIKESGAVVTHAPLPTLNIHVQEMTQLLQNLVGNALKFRSQEPPRIHVGAQRAGDEWIFSVTDNGIGIDPQHADRIFELFQRLHPHDAYPGSGLGLAICKKIVEREGGRIWVEAGEPRGSVLRFTLPAR